MNDKQAREYWTQRGLAAEARERDLKAENTRLAEQNVALVLALQDIPAVRHLRAAADLLQRASRPEAAAFLHRAADVKETTEYPHPTPVLLGA